MGKIHIKILSVLLVVLVAFSPMGVVYAADQTVALPASAVVVTNNAGTSDMVEVDGLTAGDVVKVYLTTDGKTVVGIATVGAGKDKVVISIPQLGEGAGSIFVSVTSLGKLESGRTEVTFDAEVHTDKLSASHVSVTNNYGISDIVYINELTSGDIIKVYTDETGGMMLGTATVMSGRTEVTIKIAQLGDVSGKIYVSVTSKGKLESARTEVAFDGEVSSTAPSADNVEITNNAGINDIIKIKALASGDVVKIYRDAADTTSIGTATVGSGKDSAEIHVAQLGAAAGEIYVTITSTGKTESTKTKVAYAKEAASASPAADKVVVTNNATISDIVKVSGLADNDLVKVYLEEDAVTATSSAKVPIGKNYAEVKVPQLDGDGGDIYVTVTSVGKVESERTKVTYGPEMASNAPAAADITVTNNAGLKDTIKVVNLNDGDMIKVYEDASAASPLGWALCPTGKKEAVVNISQLGTDAGTVYVTITSVGKLESPRTDRGYLAEGISAVPDAGNIEITNNAGMPDIVKVTHLQPGDTVKVYDSTTGSITMGYGNVPNGRDMVEIKINQLGSSAGSVKVSVTSVGLQESVKQDKAFGAEQQSTQPSASNIIVTNNSGTTDTVKVVSLSKGDIVKIYTASTGGNLIGTGAVSANKTEAVVNIVQLGTKAGTIYVAVTSIGRLESDRTEKTVDPEPQSAKPDENNIVVANNSGIKDTVTVKGLTQGDIVKVYTRVYAGESGFSIVGTATVSTGKTEAVVNILQLGPGDGSVFVTVRSPGKLESDKTEKEYDAEAKSAALADSQIDVDNFKGIKDIITVSGLEPGDTVRVYAAETGGTALGSGTVTAGNTKAVVSVSQLGSGSGKVYVSVAKLGKQESEERTAKDYDAEPISTDPDDSKVLVINNTGADLIVVYDLNPGDIVKIYKNSSDTNEIAKGTVSSGQSQVVLTVRQLGSTAGNIYITVTSVGMNESNKITVPFSGE